MLPVETKRQRVNMLSAVSSQGKVRFMIYQDTMNQQRLIRFMERLIRDSKQKVFLILDNLKVHHGQACCVLTGTPQGQNCGVFPAVLCSGI